jgi:hypothetical protein
LALAIAAPLFAVSAASAATLYSETSNGANPALAVTGLTPNGEAYAAQGNTGDPANTVILDNVVVPSYPAPGFGGLAVTQVTVNDLQHAGAPATSYQLYYSTITADRTQNSDPQIAAPTAVGSPVNVAGNAGASTVITPVQFGDGINTLFTLTDSQLNFTDPGVTTGAEFLLGFKSSTTGTDQGLRLAKPDTGYENPVEYYEYNTSTPGQATFTFFQQGDANDGAGIWVTVTGNILPEPATFGMAAIGGLMFLARRPRKEEKVA